MASPRKIAPPAPLTKKGPDGETRSVAVPPTVGKHDHDLIPPAKGKLRADFYPDEFIRVLHQHGKHVRWTKALICPCLQAETQQAKLVCAVCDGSGYTYVDPIDIQALMSAFDKGTRTAEKFGIWLEGMTQVTVEPRYRLGFRDRLEMHDSLMTFNETIKKGNRRGIRSTLPTRTDSARYRIVNLTKMVWLSASGALLEADPAVDYRIDENGWIVWTLAGHAKVADGTVLSVHYDFHPVYVVISHPHAIRDDVSGAKSETPTLSGGKSATDTVRSFPIAAAAKLDYLLNPNEKVSS